MRASRKIGTTGTGQERCDIKVWSGECRQSSDMANVSDYLCSVCGTIPSLNHEMRHEVFPYISGDTDSLS